MERIKKVMLSREYYPIRWKLPIKLDRAWLCRFIYGIDIFVYKMGEDVK